MAYPAYSFPLTPNQYRPASEPRLHNRFPQKDIYSPAQTSATNERLMFLPPPQSRQHSETTISKFQTERLSNSEPLEIPVNSFRTNPQLANPSTNWSTTPPSSTTPRTHARMHAFCLSMLSLAVSILKNTFSHLHFCPPLCIVCRS